LVTTSMVSLKSSKNLNMLLRPRKNLMIRKPLSTKE
jgi:hypothetical protein